MSSDVWILELGFWNLDFGAWILELKTEMPPSQAMRHFVCRPSAASLAAGSAVVNRTQVGYNSAAYYNWILAKSIPKIYNVFRLCSDIWPKK